ncbi:NUDIX hydrolase [Frondihabitans cladoniiphilus]|uniref:NUDIX domain-containing protein n=1 Tax=Frondihabitans cladoniiphilus TaxID=715785 RepID=A0ABP8W9L8_9MICO
MSIHGPADGWVVAPDGQKYWGKNGAAGLVVVDADERVLLQHRVGWSHHGGTWGVPGGARQFDESAVEGALRESAEEAAVPRDALRLLFTSAVDLGFWSYTTVVARATRSFDPVISDGESEDLAWVPLADVESLPLHPGFAASWPRLAETLRHPLHLVVDGANVVGSRPDGWWRDRAGAAGRLLGALEVLAANGVPASALVAVEPALAGAVDAWFPDVTLVVEGEAKSVGDPRPGSLVELLRAPTDGDSAVVAAVQGLLAPESGPAAAAPRVVVVTADRELAARVAALGASVVGPGILLALLP